MEVKNKLNLYIVAGQADAGPPLGTILGNLGVNSTNFCKEFNVYTEDLPNFLTLSVTVNVFNNKTFKFIINELPLGKLINLFKIDKITEIQGKELIESSIASKVLVQLALFKFPELTLSQAMPIVLGTVKSANIRIV